MNDHTEYLRETSEAEPVQNSAVPEQLLSDLAEFLQMNPSAQLEVDDNASFIKNLWDEPAIAIVLDPADNELVAALNALYFPPALSAVWHADLNALEVIVYERRMIDTDLSHRSFEYRYEETRHRCEFADASDRLLAISKAFRRAGPQSETDYRGLRHLRGSLYLGPEHRTRFDELVTGFFEEIGVIPNRVAGTELGVGNEAAMSCHEPKDGEQSPGQGENVPDRAISFWIYDLEWDDDRVISLIRSLNFYMRFFDEESPRIAIYTVGEPSRPRREIQRYPHGLFPAVISGRQLDPYLLRLWQSADVRDPFIQYLYSYQVLEYAAFYFLQDASRKTVRRLLSAPDMPSRIDEVTRNILEILVDERGSEDVRINRVVEQYVNPDVVWRLISAYSDAFCSETRFDGGYAVPALVREGWTVEDFRTSWHPKLADTLRKLRNALVHARELREGTSVTPSFGNYSRLNPWAQLIHTVAAEVILYQDV